MASPFIGQITLFPYNFAPLGWAFCAGQLLPINQNTALFSLLGVQFGGNGTSNFQPARSARPHPDRARPGAWAVELRHGWRSGRGSCHADPSDDPGPFAWLPGVRGRRDNQCAERRPACRRAVRRARGGPVNTYTATGSTVSLAAGQVAAASGGGAPHNNLQPYLTANWCIALQGIFPARN